ncbi:hypothetical protein E4U42_003465 [Claviceps africana]|uniref:Uncharacterized protein n=1 Tax=Claviceps africana TaxID=83212 RepID=A0A8K0NJE6_9HYPO|nr:hypothetical protein E4U42_003465 [Claviceps africana]
MMAPKVQLENASRGAVSTKQYKNITLKFFDRMGYDYKQDFTPEDPDPRKAMEDYVLELVAIQQYTIGRRGQRKSHGALSTRTQQYCAAREGLSQL